jgi:glycosyltransferase involved in cell wall biosynthesis
MLVSVITPCLNARDWLERCLDSVAAQTYPHVEHIVVDGASTDGTVELLRSREVRFISEPDSGQTNAINKGFRLARGDVLGWLNADDALRPDAVERVANAFRENPSAGWTYGRCRVERDGESELSLPPPRHIRRTTLEFGNLLTQPGFFLTRWALDKVGGLDESFDLAMDYDLWLRLADAPIPPAFVRGSLATYEIHAESKTGAVPPAAFLSEEAEALLKSGRTRQAAFVFGRVASISASSSGSLGAIEVDEAVRLAMKDLEARGRDSDLGAVAAGAYVEAAMIELRRSPYGVHHLLRPTVWRYPDTRARLRRAGRFFVHSAAMRVRAVLSR